MLPKPITSKRILNNEKLTKDELSEFMRLNGISRSEFAEILGVSTQAVKLWLTGDRDFSVTNSRLVRLMIKYPNIIREF